MLTSWQMDNDLQQQVDIEIQEMKVLEVAQSFTAALVVLFADSLKQ